MRSGVAELPLHTGKAPRWLFARMVRLAGAVVQAVVEDQGPHALLRRLADPFWFQAFGCVLGFDWHSSGVTTTTCGAIKTALGERGRELELAAAGGKGAAGRRTPEEIQRACEHSGADAAALAQASRLAAKVDSAAVQDGFDLYHHAFFFTADGQWCVVQQGMDAASRTARRYHWLSDALVSYVEEPHTAVCCDQRRPTLNLVAAESAPVRTGSVALIQEGVEETLRLAERLPTLRMPARHELRPVLDIDPRYLRKVLLRTYEAAPKDYEALLRVPGVGAKTLRALALVAELVYGTPASTRDPARFAFAHGGKDGTPYPVDRETYDRTIAVLEGALGRSPVGAPERDRALRRLAQWAAAAGRASVAGSRPAAARTNPPPATDP